MKIQWVVVSVVALASACTGDTGPQGPQGPQGPAGSNGTNGTDGQNGQNGQNGMNGSNGTNGSDIIISDRAKHGLDIAPVTLDLTNKTAAELEAIGQGSYILNAVGDCAGCHGQPGSTPGYLAGTTAAGAFNARNLTPDPTTGLQLTEDQFVDVMRNGTNYTCTGGTCTSAGNGLSVMPWADFRWGSVSDLKAIYAYLRVIPAVSNAVNADTGTHPAAGAYDGTFLDGSTAYTLPAELDANNAPIPDPDSVRRGLNLQVLGKLSVTDAQTETLVGRGAYLVTAFGACNGCHTNPSRVSGKINASVYLAGGRVFAFPAAAQAGLGVVRSMSADLLGKTNGFFGPQTTTPDDFATYEGMIDTGSHVEDADPKPLASPMPWQHLRNLTLADQEAIYTYLRETSAASGETATNDKVTREASYYCAADADCDTGETCDLTSTSATYHECIGRSCLSNNDCAACQTCDLTGTHTCGGPIIANCTAGI